MNHAPMALHIPSAPQLTPQKEKKRFFVFKMHLFVYIYCSRFKHLTFNKIKMAIYLEPCLFID